MFQANGETRKQIAIAAATAAAAAIFAKLGEWAIDEIRTHLRPTKEEKK